MQDTSTTTIPVHQRPESCHVCGWPEADHQTTSVWAGVTSHTFWSNADALAEAREHDRRSTVTYSTGAASPESAFVAEHIPEAVSA